MTALDSQLHVLSDAQRDHYREQGWLSVPGLVDDAWLDAAAGRHRRVRRPEPRAHRVERALRPRRTATRPTSRACAGSARRPTCTRRTGSSRRTSVIADVAVDLLGPGREVPPLEAQLQGGARRRRGEVAPGHPVLAAHQLRPPDDRRVPRGRRAGHGRGRVRARAATTARCSTSTTATPGWARSADDDVDAAPASASAAYPDGPGGHDHRAQLPHRPRLGAERLGSGTPAAAADLRRRRCVLVHRPRQAVAARRGADPRRAAPRWARHDPRPCLVPPSGPYRPIFAVAAARAVGLDPVRSGRGSHPEPIVPARPGAHRGADRTGRPGDLERAGREATGGAALARRHSADQRAGPGARRGGDHRSVPAVAVAPGPPQLRGDRPRRRLVRPDRDCPRRVYGPPGPRDDRCTAAGGMDGQELGLPPTRAAGPGRAAVLRRRRHRPRPGDAFAGGGCDAGRRPRPGVDVAAHRDGHCRRSRPHADGQLRDARVRPGRAHGAAVVRSARRRARPLHHGDAVGVRRRRRSRASPATSSTTCASLVG